jgi:hypothetical protein
MRTGRLPRFCSLCLAISWQVPACPERQARAAHRSPDRADPRSRHQSQRARQALHKVPQRARRHHQEPDQPRPSRFGRAKRLDEELQDMTALMDELRLQPRPLLRPPRRHPQGPQAAPEPPTTGWRILRALPGEPAFDLCPQGGHRERRRPGRVPPDFVPIFQQEYRASARARPCRPSGPLPPLHLAQHHHPPARRPDPRQPLRPARRRAGVRPPRHRPHPARQALQEAHRPRARLRYKRFVSSPPSRARPSSSATPAAASASPAPKAASTISKRSSTR